jgi:hypothetical protein
MSFIEIIIVEKHVLTITWQEYLDEAIFPLID